MFKTFVRKFPYGKRHYRIIATIVTSNDGIKISWKSTLKNTPFDMFKQVFPEFQDYIIYNGFSFKNKKLYWYENALYFALNEESDSLKRALMCDDETLIKVRAFIDYAINKTKNKWAFYETNDQAKEMFKKFIDGLNLEEQWREKVKELEETMQNIK